jgi:hypothetical protein
VRIVVALIVIGMFAVFAFTDSSRAQGAYRLDPS